MALLTSTERAIRQAIDMVSDTRQQSLQTWHEDRAPWCADRELALDGGDEAFNQCAPAVQVRGNAWRICVRTPCIRQAARPASLG
jgi:hypothetical protein